MERLRAAFSRLRNRLNRGGSSDGRQAVAERATATEAVAVPTDVRWAAAADVPRYDRLGNIGLVGPMGAGKSGLRLMLLSGSPRTKEDLLPTTGVDFAQCAATGPVGTTRFIVWDLGGDPRFASVLAAFVRKLQCALVCVAADDPLGVVNAEAHMEALRLQLPNDSRIVVVRSRCDRAAAFPVHELRAVARRHSAAAVVSVSAATGEGFDEVLGLCYAACPQPVLHRELFQKA